MLGGCIVLVEGDGGVLVGFMGGGVGEDGFDVC